MLKVLRSFWIHQNLFKYWLKVGTLCPGWPCKLLATLQLKSANLQYNKLGRWVARMLGRKVAGTNDSSTKSLMFQALFFFHNLGHSKLFIFMFVKLLKGFFQRILQEIMKKTGAWSSHRPRDPAYYIEDCWIFKRYRLSFGILISKIRVNL